MSVFANYLNITIHDVYSTNNQFRMTLPAPGWAFPDICLNCNIGFIRRTIKANEREWAKLITADYTHLPELIINSSVISEKYWEKALLNAYSRGDIDIINLISNNHRFEPKQWGYNLVGA